MLRSAHVSLRECSTWQHQENSAAPLRNDDLVTVAERIVPVPPVDTPR
jgi:hypothetical protein